MRVKSWFAVVAVLSVAVAGLAARAVGQDLPTTGAVAALNDGAGTALGKVSFTEEHGRVTVRVRARSLSPGFHGFHVHAVGTCTAPAFTSAGSHFAAAGKSHPAHAGDMPVLLVNSDGKTLMRFRTDGFKLAELFDADGSAVIVHASPDNYANVPARYAPTGPDAATLGTGDAGGRTACGVIERRAV